MVPITENSPSSSLDDAMPPGTRVPSSTEHGGVVARPPGRQASHHPPLHDGMAWDGRWPFRPGRATRLVPRVKSDNKGPARGGWCTPSGPSGAAAVMLDAEWIASSRAFANRGACPRRRWSQAIAINCPARGVSLGDRARHIPPSWPRGFKSRWHCISWYGQPGLKEARLDGGGRDEALEGAETA